MKKLSLVVTLACLLGPIVQAEEKSWEKQTVFSMKGSDQRREFSVGYTSEASPVTVKGVLGESRITGEKRKYYGGEVMADFLNGRLTAGIGSKIYTNEKVKCHFEESGKKVCKELADDELTFMLGANVYDGERLRVQPYYMRDLQIGESEYGINTELKFKGL